MGESKKDDVPVLAGLKSYVAIIGSAVIAPWAVKHLGVVLTPDQQLQVAAGAVAIVGTVMRSLTKVAPFAGLRRLLRPPPPPPQPVEITPELVKALVKYMAPDLLRLMDALLKQRLKEKEKGN